MRKLQWNFLKDEKDLETIKQLSAERPQVIYKHSTRCYISTMVRRGLENSHPPAHIDFHFLDLIAYRSISNRISEEFGVIHESPQVLVIRDGKSIFDASHDSISMEEIAQAV